jgi:WD40 repeat protein
MVKLWDAATGAALRTLKGYTDSINSVAFLRDSVLLASASRDKAIKLWDAATGAAPTTLKGHTGSVNSTAFLDGALLASASCDKTVRLWDAATGAALKIINVDSYVCTLPYCSDGLFLDTDRGLFSLEGYYPLGVSPQPVPRAQVSLHGNRVVQNLERHLWLPPEYPPARSAFGSNSLALGHWNGRVTVIEFHYAW